MPHRLIVLASGSGSLFQALIDACSTNDIDAQIVALITDRACVAEERAAAENIPVHRLDPTDRDAWDVVMTQTLADLEPDLVVSAGFMRILGPRVVSTFEGDLINTHPALLPKFPGAHAVRDALSAGATVTGSTVHFVDEGMDTGAIIAQQEVAIELSDDEESLHERIKVVERALLVDTVKRLLNGSVYYRDGEAVHS